MGAIELLGAWDRAREKPRYRWGGVALGIVIAAGLASVPVEGLTVTAQRAAAVSFLMAFWWLGGVLPAPVTGMVPLVAFPLLGVASTKEVAAPYADPLIYLMLGGFVLGYAMEAVGLHRRLVALLLGPAWVRARPDRVVLALMAATAAISGFVSNTGTMVMMLPMGLAMAAHVSSSTRVRSAFVLSLAYSCSIGGVATLVGTAPNAVFAGMASSIAHREVKFVEWMAVGVPFVVLALPVAWFVVNRLTLRLPDASDAPIERPEKPEWAPGEAAVLTIILACFALWITRSPVDLGVFVVPGWSQWVAVKVDDGFVAISAAMVLFLLPGRAGFLLDWKACAAKIPWGVLLLLGGGFAMADVIQSSGLTAFLAERASGLAALPPWLATAVICVGNSVVSAVPSNTATTQVALPLLAAGAAVAGVSPLAWMLPATISASCDFTLAVGTPPNAIAAEAGDVSPGDMAFAGILLNIACALIATIVSLTFGAAVFG